MSILPLSTTGAILIATTSFVSAVSTGAPLVFSANATALGRLLRVQTL